jgi:hypothetical protein
MMNEQIRKAVIPTVVGVASFSVGGALGYILGRRKERNRRVELTNTAVEAMRAYSRYDNEATEKVYKGEHSPYYTKPEVLEDIDVVQVAYNEIMTDGSVEVVRSAIGVPYEVADGSWNWERELNERANKVLYVICQEEFFADDQGYRQATINWYEADRMVTDSLEEPIYNWSSIIGTELPFGHGTDDENTLYIRNESLRMEWEILRNQGHSDVDLDGLELQDQYDQEDLKHSVTPLKFRRE